MYKYFKGNNLLFINEEWQFLKYNSQGFMKYEYITYLVFRKWFVKQSLMKYEWHCMGL